jgi:antitoxin CcdA
MTHAHERCASALRMSPERMYRGPLGRETLEFHRAPTATRRPINLSVRRDLIAAARAERLNLSALFERALEAELAQVRWRHWRETNAQGIEAYNRQVRSGGTFAQRWLWRW